MHYLLFYDVVPDSWSGARRCGPLTWDAPS